MKGRCECGKVSFDVQNPRDTIRACHCKQCRRMTGHYIATTHAEYDDVTFHETEGLEWYTSSEWAKRGFCKFCGSSLFYRLNTESGIAISAGCLEGPTGMNITKHIFVKDKGDYYTIDDGAVQIDTY